MQGAPKGSYHNYCRSNLSGQQTHRVRSVRTSNSNNRPSHPTEQFNDFETYLRYLQQKERQDAHSKPRPHTTDYRSPLTSRPETRPRTTARPELQLNRENAQEREVTQGVKEEELVKPYFPFFKCRIEGEPRVEKLESQFRLRSHKFKLNYRIIEENMGRR